jgi:hypothetical protein
VCQRRGDLRGGIVESAESATPERGFTGSPMTERARASSREHDERDFPIRPSGRLRSSTDTHRQDIDDTHMIRHACSLHAVTHPVCSRHRVWGRLEALGERATRGSARDELTRPARRCTTAKDDSKQGLAPCSCLCRLYAASVSLSFERVVLPADYRLRNGLGAVGATAAIAPLGLGLPVALPLGALS